MARLGRAYPAKVIRLNPHHLVILFANAAATDTATASATAQHSLTAAAAASDTASASALANVDTVSTVTVTTSVVDSVAFMPQMIGNAGSTMLPDNVPSVGSVHSLSGSQSVAMV